MDVSVLPPRFHKITNKERAGEFPSGLSAVLRGKAAWFRPRRERTAARDPGSNRSSQRDATGRARRPLLSGSETRVIEEKMRRGERVTDTPTGRNGGSDPRGGRGARSRGSPLTVPATLTGGPAVRLLLRAQPPPRYRRRRHEGQQPEQQRQAHQLRHLRELHVSTATATSASGLPEACTSPRGRARTRGGARPFGASRGAWPGRCQVPRGVAW